MFQKSEEFTRPVTEKYYNNGGSESSIYQTNGAAIFLESSLDYLEFIARVTSHIPDKGQVTVRYYGLYANTHRGKVRKAAQNPLALRLAEEEGKRIPSKGWAAMIRKVYEVDPMACPKCGNLVVLMASMRAALQYSWLP